ncbi:hypothetical protein OXR01_11625 [Staphylococcus gallinarum]|nr:hypothetical protein [Staphylococcus gallinarum]MDN6414550.1 hypothetical protein [Staphylococcus gallinarum]MEB6055664.1 hypothetical protein [Staphylococcus gallinarum]UEH02153.1 hypothetical protein K3U27_10705 [Staphylococcus gallinarum]
MQNDHKVSLKTVVFRFETIEARKPRVGEVQVDSIYLSIDPYMRGRMNDTKSNIQPF